VKSSYRRKLRKEGEENPSLPAGFLEEEYSQSISPFLGRAGMSFGGAHLLLA
jgi:hypothetical protein